MQQKLFKWGSAILVLTTVLGGCSSNNEESVANTKPNVIASYSVLCDLTKQIAEDTINLDCLVDSNEDPHAYQATPRDRQAIEKAELVLYGGYEHEGAIYQLIEAAEISAPKIAVHEKAVPNPIMSEHHHHHHEDEHEEHGHEEETAKAEEAEPDPHVWHDVQNTLAMVKIVQDSLTEINPQQAELYNQNAQELTNELETLNTWIQEQIATIPETQRKLVTTHDALSYYAQAYGLEKIGALQGVIPDEQPTASQVKTLVNTIQETKVPTIFVEANVNDKIIGTVAREANVNVANEKLLVDSLGTAENGTDTYVGMMQFNTCTIVTGLGGQCSSNQ